MVTLHLLRLYASFAECQLCCLYLQLSRDIDRLVDRPVDRAVVRVNAVCPFRRFSLVWIAQLQLVRDVNPLDNKDVTFFFDLANRIRAVGLRVRRYFARLKGAAKCSG